MLLEQPQVSLTSVQGSEPPLYQRTVVSARIASSPLFLLDNKTLEGRFGYEVFALAETDAGVIALSLGWLSGSADRDELPDLTLPVGIAEQSVTWRMPPTNPVLGVDANSRHPDQNEVWIVQSLTKDWLQQVSGYPVLGFAQLDDAAATGVGPVIWQPSVMTPMKHLAYAVQWFSMAAALLGMFLYAGFKPVNGRDPVAANNRKNRGTKSE